MIRTEYESKIVTSNERKKIYERKVFPKKIPLPDEITKDGSREVLSNDTDIAHLFTQQCLGVQRIWSSTTQCRF